MVVEAPPSSVEPANAEKIGAVVVGIGGAGHCVHVVEEAALLAEALDAPLEAVHVETGHASDEEHLANLNDALTRAQQLGALVSKIPATTVADGLSEYAASANASHMVLGYWPPRPTLGSRRPLIDQLIALGVQADLVLIPRSTGPVHAHRRMGNWRGTPGEYAAAVLAVAATAAVAWVLRSTTGVISTAILFLFPVIGVAARSGLGPTLFAVALAVGGHNLLFLQPAFRFDATAAQSWIMAAVLLVGGCYTSILTATLRRRVKLSDRSARDNASLAKFAQRLTRLSDWTSTGEAVCEEIGALLGASAMIFRQVNGRLVNVAAYPTGAALEPIDEIAMQWAWEGEDNGSAAAIQAGNWQFYPLSTSLGVLAVIGLARPDGQPITPDQTVLLSTLLAQASLAHERLRLEDELRRK